MSFKRTQDDCSMFHNHLVTLKKFLALTLNPVEVTVVRTVCLMLMLCGMLVHAAVASRAVGWPLVIFSSGYAITGLSTIRKFNCFFAQRFWLFYLRWNVMAMVSQKHFENLINCVICYAVRSYWFFPFWQNRKGFRLLLSLRQKPYFLIRFMLQAHKDTHTQVLTHSEWSKHCEIIGQQSVFLCMSIALSLMNVIFSVSIKPVPQSIGCHGNFWILRRPSASAGQHSNHSNTCFHHTLIRKDCTLPVRDPTSLWNRFVS